MKSYKELTISMKVYRHCTLTRESIQINKSRSKTGCSDRIILILNVLHKSTFYWMDVK